MLFIVYISLGVLVVQTMFDGFPVLIYANNVVSGGYTYVQNFTIANIDLDR